MNSPGPIRQILSFITLTALMVVVIYGAQTIRDKDFYNKAGFFEVRTSPYGLYLTVPDSGVFYNFSPYDTFTKTPDTQNNLLVWEDNVTSQEAQIAETYLKKPIQIYNTILSYGGQTNPTATFIKGGRRTVYTSEVDGNTIYVKMPVNRILSISHEENLYISLSFNENDYIFDEKGNEYNNRSPEDISNFNMIYPFRLNSMVKSSAQQEELLLVGVNYLFIANRNYNGIIRVPINTPDYTLEKISFQYKLIQYLITNKNEPTIKVEIFDNIGEATRDL
jgi:hypothetical protein